MDWKKIAPWNWFKQEEAVSPTARRLPGFGSPGDPFAALRAEMDRVFEDAVRHSFPRMPSLAEASASKPTPLRPVVDISEGRKAYTVRVELPGVEPDDVSIEVEEHTLVLRADKRQTREEEDEGYHCVERSYGAVQRVLSLPDDADPEGIQAHFKHGVLKLRIPKQPARASSARSIPIEKE
jgi:HSP20 family protein